MEDDSIAPIPNPVVQQQVFLLQRDGSSESTRRQALEKLLQNIDQDEMAPYLTFLLSDARIAAHLPQNEERLQKLRAKNENELARLEAAQKQAEDSEGDVELHTEMKQRPM